MAWKQWGASLDRLPARAGLPLGLGLGVLAGGLLLLAPASVWLPAFLVFFVATGFLAWSGEPVEVLPAPRVESVSGVPVSKAPAAGFEMVPIPAGRFLMGSPDEEKGQFGDEGPLHEVGISAFLCMNTPVTRRLYAAVMGTDPGSPKGKADDRPVNNVHWLDAVDFCNKLSEREGLAPCYERAGAEVTWHSEAGGFRLPTEAEWEYVCRAGTQTRWSFGDAEERLTDYAWFEANSGGNPRPVGQKKPNSWGLYDVHGNVWEWCWDWYSAYEAVLARDPAGPSEGSARVVRGGSFFNTTRNLRSAIRNRFRPDFRYTDFGFRCVRGLRRQL